MKSASKDQFFFLFRRCARSWKKFRFPILPPSGRPSSLGIIIGARRRKIVFVRLSVVCMPSMLDAPKNVRQHRRILSNVCYEKYFEDVRFWPNVKMSHIVIVTPIIIVATTCTIPTRLCVLNFHFDIRSRVKDLDRKIDRAHLPRFTVVFMIIPDAHYIHRESGKNKTYSILMDHLKIYQIYLKKIFFFQFITSSFSDSIVSCD